MVQTDLKKYDSLKETSRKGCKIKYIETLLAEEFVYLYNWFIPVFVLFYSFKYEQIVNYLEAGAFSYAFPVGIDAGRFQDEDVIRIEHRLRRPRIIEDQVKIRVQIILMLKFFDKGYGTADDTIDYYQGKRSLPT